MQCGLLPVMHQSDAYSSRDSMAPITRGLPNGLKSSNIFSCGLYNLTFHYLPLDPMVNIPLYLVWECWVQLNSILFADHVTFNNGYMKGTHTRQKM